MSGATVLMCFVPAVLQFPPLTHTHTLTVPPRTVPDEQAHDFAEALRGAGVERVEVKVYRGKSHTDPIIEDLMFFDRGKAKVCCHPKVNI